MPVEEKNHFYNLRYVACTWDAGDIIAKAHLKLHHASKSPFLIVYVRYTDVYRGREVLPNPSGLLLRHQREGRGLGA
jgi:hypothetical protein